MFLKEKVSGHLVEVLEVGELFDPYKSEVTGRSHFGEEAQDPEGYQKDGLIFPSGESLPRCWTDVHYRDDEVGRRR